MSKRDAQCANCGHFYSTEQPYYSEDFACYFSPGPAFSLTWCFHCTYTSIHNRPWFLRIVGAPFLRLKATLPTNLISDHPFWLAKDDYMGLFAGAHLLRMIWHCLIARTALDRGDANQEESAMHLALKKLPPSKVALMALMTAKAPEIIPLEQQIQEGLYLEEYLQISTLKALISSSPDAIVAVAALEVLSNFPET
ncbi:MAG TPA: hypothetical protein VLX28_16255 [Thermoanaerobaculia bacterium]|nr:hypothetical protein [Thermoanaerobaculia bacterium]